MPSRAPAGSAAILCAILLAGASPSRAEGFSDPEYGYRFREALAGGWHLDPEAGQALRKREGLTSSLRAAWLNERGALVMLLAQRAPRYLPPAFFVEQMPGEIAEHFGIPEGAARGRPETVGEIPASRIEAVSKLLDRSGTGAREALGIWWNVEFAGTGVPDGKPVIVDLAVLYRGDLSDAESPRLVEGWLRTFETDPRVLRRADPDAIEARVEREGKPFQPSSPEPGPGARVETPTPAPAPAPAPTPPEVRTVSKDALLDGVRRAVREEIAAACPPIGDVSTLAVLPVVRTGGGVETRGLLRLADGRVVFESEDRAIRQTLDAPASGLLDPSRSGEMIVREGGTTWRFRVDTDRLWSWFRASILNEMGEAARAAPRP